MTLSTHHAPEGGGSTGSPPGADDLEAGFDLFRLDCAVDALRHANLSQHDRAELARIAANLADIMETVQ